MRYLHEMIVDDVGKVIRWKPIGLHQNLNINIFIISPCKEKQLCGVGKPAE